MKTLLRDCFALAILVSLLVPPAALALGQGTGQGQQPPKAPQQPAKPGGFTLDAPSQPAPAAVNKEEEDAYKAFFQLKNNEVQQQVQAGEAFLKKFPDSRYTSGVYARLTSAYLSLGQEDKMFAAGDKALELDPSNVDVLAMLALVLPRRVTPGSLDADQKLQKSENYSKKAIALLAELLKPADWTDEVFLKAKNEKLSMCHSGLGVVYFHRQKYADSANELEQATKLASAPDPVDFFVLGLAYENAQRFSEAGTAFGHCGEIPGPLQDRCKKAGDEAKQLALRQPSAPKP